MEKINLNEYEVKEIVQDDDNQYNEMLNYLFGILKDRNIPEENKQLIRKQYDEIMKMKMISMKPPKIILTKK